MATDWAEEYEERAAIMEFDGGLSRDDAEYMAQMRIVILKRKAQEVINDK